MTIAESPTEPESEPRKKGFARIHLTRRAIILLAIVAGLALTYANSLQIYFDQQMQIAQARQEIATHQERIGKLQDEIARWQDPEFVKAQARSRFGWVVPGETGYRVIGPDGKLIGGGVELNNGQDAVQPEQKWWQRLWGSVETADDPAAKKPQGGGGTAVSPNPTSTP